MILLSLRGIAPNDANHTALRDCLQLGAIELIDVNYLDGFIHEGMALWMYSFDQSLETNFSQFDTLAELELQELPRMCCVVDGLFTRADCRDDKLHYDGVCSLCSWSCVERLVFWFLLAARLAVVPRHAMDAVGFHEVAIGHTTTALTRRPSYVPTNPSSSIRPSLRACLYMRREIESCSS